MDVSTIATACADRFDAVAQRRDVTLSVLHHGEGQAWISAPPEWIDRLTAVLVDNACRYAGRGGTVHIIVTVASNRVSLAVEDSGPGIAPEERARLFDRFHRATDEGNGSGLGLAIADSVVRATGVSGGSTMPSSEVLAWRSGGTDLRAFETLVTGPNRLNGPNRLTGPNRPQPPPSTPEGQRVLA